MAISIDRTRIILTPNSQHPNSRIQIDNLTGEINISLFDNKLTLEEVDKIIENLKLAEKISEEIINSKV